MKLQISPIMFRNLFSYLFYISKIFISALRVVRFLIGSFSLFLLHIQGFKNKFNIIETEIL